MKWICLLALALSSCASRPDCEAQSRAAVPTYADSITELLKAVNLEQRFLAR